MHLAGNGPDPNERDADYSGSTVAIQPFPRRTFGLSLQWVFETLEDVAIDAALNELRLEGWNRSPDPIVPENGGVSPEVEDDGQPSRLALD